MIDELWSSRDVAPNAIPKIYGEPMFANAHLDVNYYLHCARYFPKINTK